MTALRKWGLRLKARPEQLRAPPQASPHLRTHSNRADTRKRKKVFSTRKWCSQGSQEPLEPARSRRRTQTVPASYMVFRVRKGPQVLEGFTLEKGGTRDPEAAVRLSARTTCVLCHPKAKELGPHSLPNSIAEKNSCAQERWEAEQGEEDGAHV